MISKEKLLNGYVKTNNRELVRLFLSECLKYDDINLPIISFRTFTDWEHFAVSDSGTPCSHGISGVSEKEELTLEDFKSKQKSKVTYELVTDMTNNEIAKAMIDGEVFYSNSGIYRYGWDGKCFVNDFGVRIDLAGKFYRKVEKEIDWHDEAKDFLSKCTCLSVMCDLSLCVSKLSSGDPDVLKDWEHLQSEFIKLCHTVAELTDKPE